MERISEQPESENRPLHTGLRLTDLTDDVFKTVVGMYYRHAYGDHIPGELYVDCDDLLEFSQLRLGSRFSMHSKLELVYHPVTRSYFFDFYVNSENPRYGDVSCPEGAEVAATREAFRTEVDEYLAQTGLGVALDR